MSNIINVTIDDSIETVGVTINDGVISTAGSSGTFISGFEVKKGVGNVAATIEVGDYISGWIADVWIAGKVLTIPVTDVSDLTGALQGEII